MGYYFRGRHELLLVGRRGEMPVPTASCRPESVIEAPRRGHSEKPALVYELLEGMYPSAARLELFARSSRPGWDSWGWDADRAGGVVGVEQSGPGRSVEFDCVVRA